MSRRTPCETEPLAVLADAERRLSSRMPCGFSSYAVYRMLAELEPAQFPRFAWFVAQIADGLDAADAARAALGGPPRPAAGKPGGA